MAEASELIEFRRAFFWLLCGMLLPSVALVAFGVVAVANERAAVEQRLAEDYQARLRILAGDLAARFDRAAAAVAAAGARAFVRGTEGEAKARSGPRADPAEPAPGGGRGTKAARPRGAGHAPGPARADDAPPAAPRDGTRPASSRVDAPTTAPRDDATAPAAARDPSVGPRGGATSTAKGPGAGAGGSSAPPAAAGDGPDAAGAAGGAEGAARGPSRRAGGDPLVASVRPLDEAAAAADPALAEAARRAQTLPIGGHLFVTSDAEGERRAFVLVRAADAQGERTLLGRLQLEAVVGEIQALAAARFPRERAGFRLLPPRDQPGGLAALKRMVAEVSPSSDPATVVARLPLEAPLEGFTLAAEIHGDDPAAALAFRNRTLYIALLGLLYTGIGVGFGLTIRELRRGYKLSRLKTDFVANISHELRTPLTSVRLFAETLKEGRASSPEEVRECLAMMSHEAERLSNLVEKLLDWSRVESGRRTVQREPVLVADLLEHVATVFRAQQLGASYETDLEPGLPVLSVDRDAMAQVVLNLLHNAVKYTGDDKRIRLRARKGRGEVIIEVEDNGPGVRPQDRKKIFDRFYRADDLLSRKTEGSGLGLAIAKRIVEGHGGRVEVDSHLGRGSVFRVHLPLFPAPAVT